MITTLPRHLVHDVAPSAGAHIRGTPRGRSPPRPARRSLGSGAGRRRVGVSSPSGQLGHRPAVHLDPVVRRPRAVDVPVRKQRLHVVAGSLAQRRRRSARPVVPCVCRCGRPAHVSSCTTGRRGRAGRCSRWFRGWLPRSRPTPCRSACRHASAAPRAGRRVPALSTVRGDTAQRHGEGRRDRACWTRVDYVRQADFLAEGGTRRSRRTCGPRFRSPTDRADMPLPIQALRSCRIEYVGMTRQATLDTGVVGVRMPA